MFSPGLRTEHGIQVHQQQQLPPQSVKHGHVGSEVVAEEEEEVAEDIDSAAAGVVARNTAENAATMATAGAMEQQEEDEVEEEDEEDDEEIEEFNPYLFIAHLPEHASVCIRDKICLPPLSQGSSRPPLPMLALDLDETLVHCTVEPIPKPDLIFPVSFNGQVYQVYVRKRPYLDYFLETVSKAFEVCVFTASQKVYADVLLDKLDPGRRFVKHRLFREACLLVQGNYLKDLHVLGRDLRMAMLVDNSPHAYSYHNDNGIPIESWYDDDTDTELLKLIGFLKTLQGVDDVRPIIREHFKTYQLVERARMGLPVSLSAPPF
mmetsp:Transcript_14942/g.24896  ORF Transcript_14942/g.24896 Transcript_14942/m.24896 type:complete len:320 (+) Transcript_14942:433-1392(+)